MDRSVRCSILCAALLVAFVCLSPVEAQEGAAAAPAPTVVLDTFGLWRMHHTLTPPVAQVGGVLKPRLAAQRWLNMETPPPPADWMAAEFDDGGWVRAPGRKAIRSPYLARLALRGKFHVTDPSKVAGLALSLEYHGGVIVYLNGKEIGRSHVPAGAPGDKAMAEAYPLETFVDENGDLLAPQHTRLADQQRTGPPSAEAVRRMGLRKRTFGNLVIPNGALRRGVNVVAIELLRAPYHAVCLETTEQAGKRRDNAFDWNTCELVSVQLLAMKADGLSPNASRPEGFQIWNGDVLQGDSSLDWGDPCEPFRPVKLVGACNGTFSGKAVLGSTQAITSLAASPGELRGPGGSIPASSVRVRYGLAWGREHGTTYPAGEFPFPYLWPGRYPDLLAMLAESPPGEIPVSTYTASPRRDGGPQPPLVNGAVVSIWITVHVPKEIPAGVYSGKVMVRADGIKPTAVPVELKVVDWTLPDPQDYRTWVEFMQSPDTLAMEYGVPLWSDRHWALIARSMDFLNGIGSRVLYVPLLAETNLGNAESMVRWIQTGRGRFDYDFSIMDKYLDLAEEHMGKPKLIVFNVWDVYLIPKEGNPTRGGHARMVRYMEGQKQERGRGPLVTVQDPKTHETETVELPTYFKPESKALWQPLFAQIAARLKKRGLEKTMMIGMVTDARPTEAEVRFFADVAPGVPWVSHGHGGYPDGYKMYDTSPIGYQACVWYTKFADGIRTHGKTWPEESLHGWQQSQLTVAFERNGDLDNFPTTRWRLMGETNITGGQRGMGRMGADFWDVIKDKDDRRRAPVFARYPDSQWMNLNICNPVLAPGADGPVATNRFEAFREGVQECEARILIERALLDENLKRRLGSELVRRCERELDERHLIMWKTLSNLQIGGTMFFRGLAWRWTPAVPGHTWYLGSGWQERSERLYSLAAEVAARLRGR